MFKLETGVLQLHSSAPAVNTQDSVKKAAAIADAQNSRSYLEAAFFNGHARTIHHEQLSTGGQLSLIIPTGPYADISFLVAAAGPETFDKEIVDTETIYDYPPELQAAYWKMIITSLKTLRDLRGSHNDQVFAVENCIVTRTSDDKRTSRSIGVPHSQILLLNTEAIVPQAWEIPALSKEQRILKSPVFLSLLRTELDKVKTDLSRSVRESLAQQYHAPFGYTFLLDQPTDFDRVAEELNTHHQAYMQAAETAVARLKPSNRDRLIPQPSYRVYLSLDADKLKVTISPEFISHAGVMEAAGIKLERSPEHPPRVTDTEIRAIAQQILAKLDQPAVKV